MVSFLLIVVIIVGLKNLGSVMASSSNPDLRPAFEVLDADRDDRISKDDLRAFYATSDIVLVDDVIIGTMMSVADSNENGFVEYDKFERVLEGRRKEVGPGAVLEEVFRVMDKDDGRLSHADLKGFMSRAAFVASDDDNSSMIRLAGNHDAGDDGFVSFDDLLRILDL